VANVSYLRAGAVRRSKQASGGSAAGTRRFRRRPVLIAGAVVVAVLVAAGAAAAVFATAKAQLTGDPQALAHVALPLGAGTIERVAVAGGPTERDVPVTVRDGRIYPVGLIPADDRLSVEVTVRRPGWIAWLAGRTERLRLTLTAPAASLRSHFLTVAHGARPTLHFKAPIEVFATGPAGHLVSHVLPSPTSVVVLPDTAVAGTAYVSAAPRRWESARQATINWFPAGGSASAVSVPEPGSAITPSTPIRLTFSRPVSRVLGGHLPPVSPATAGAWRTINAHTIEFQPQGYGYGLGARVAIALPARVRLIGGSSGADASSATWSVPPGSTLRLQQMLATLGYLPVDFTAADPSAVPDTEAAEVAAAVAPPAGTFSWRWHDTPSWLVGDWKPGTFGELTKGAVMAFENDTGVTPDGVAGPQVWRALIAAVIHGQRSSFGYTVADVSEGTPETLNLWHNGTTVLTALVNTGIPAAPTALGTFAVFEHLPVTTMSGLNPDGTPYHDPGIPWVSYFNGGDALHGYIRASYGYPQSLGCVEMPYATAGRVYPYTPIGTIVHVA
jgi:peptidoglycan hydrolase-like protein with peptidoglycan-binding domain